MRVISRLDIKNDFVIKGIHLEGLRKVGDPREISKRLYLEGVDEIILMDAVASLYDRNNLFHVLEWVSENVFVPITLGGGLRSLSDIDLALRSGADKVAINTAGIKNPNFLAEAVKQYGSQCIVASIEAKRTPTSWEVYIDNGREKTGKVLADWLNELQDLGVGEILVTSVDKEGTRKGFDIELAKIIHDTVSVPTIVSGGFGKLSDLNNLIKKVKPSAIAIASGFQYEYFSVNDIKQHLNALEVEVRI